VNYCLPSLYTSQKGDFFFTLHPFFDNLLATVLFRDPLSFLKASRCGVYFEKPHFCPFFFPSEGVKLAIFSPNQRI